MTSPYDHHWRYTIRPALLRRACYECERCGIGDRAMGLHSYLQGAHLDGDPWHQDDENLACLCRRCHRAHDYEDWARKCAIKRRIEWERKADEKDAGRELLRLMTA